MLSDRSYMRDSYGRTTTSTLTWMLCALTAGFLIQSIFERAFVSTHFSQFAEFTLGGIKSGWIWTFVTYPLLHANVILWLGNLLALYFLGRELIPQMGERRFAGFSAFAAVCGALVWTLVHFNRADDILIGATSISCALMMLFACLHPNRSMAFLFFFYPVTVKPKHIAWVLAGFSTLGLIASEIPGDRFQLNIAHSAHLGGMLAALLYYRFVYLREWRTPDGPAEIELPRWLSKTTKPPVAETLPKHVTPFPSNPRENLRAEVDRILDKINSEGLAALTPEEKRLLDDARDQLSRS